MSRADDLLNKPVNEESAHDIKDMIDDAEHLERRVKQLVRFLSHNQAVSGRVLNRAVESSAQLANVLGEIQELWIGPS